MTNNLAGLLAVTITADPTRPLLTWYDDASGDRTELSGATLANWVAKTANLVVDGAGAAAGDHAEVILPPHWQTAAVLLGCWSAGLAVRATGLAAETGQAETGPSEPAAEVQFATTDTQPAADRRPAGERYLLGLAPMAMPARDVAPGWVDYITEVRGHGDHFTPYPAVDPQDAQLAARAVRRGADLGIPPGARVLVDVDRYPDPVDWLLAPLAVEASVVLCRHLDRRLLDARADSEKVDHILT
ncbi:TIGR03089 family protein [Micromonospora sp. NBC_01813]|uniref:TIGR03089 family protein n=1 Tax=Micromonospora sp. NBC_01813 TaxID=2975988 RepID=UPI002DD8211B|nr:TIGR03089 family protein [Micromonospora sp. NBC_01813]WSA08386.1 TIGR03089 family protein [Micromonospora sp. NBC_01813]